MANIRSDTTNTHTNVFYRFIDKTIAFIFVSFVLIEMREKSRSERETVISLSKS